MFCAGIDSGSRTVKAVVLDAATSAIVASAMVDAGVDAAATATTLFDLALAEAGVARTAIARLVATGYARAAVPGADARITEITCHARGVRHLLPAARSVVEIGGQDSKVLRLDERGVVADFAMNDRCAAGTGRFLEVVAARLGTDLFGLGALAEASTEPAAISSMCVVFAESEIIGLMAGGARREDLAAGVMAAIGTRLAALTGRELAAPVVFTGGVARIPGMAAALGRALGQAVIVAPQPHLTGALGAALIACQQARGEGRG
jgi:predicted CoA-substrate-specific enzyme activase